MAKSLFTLNEKLSLALNIRASFYLTLTYKFASSHGELIVAML